MAGSNAAENQVSMEILAIFIELLKISHSVQASLAPGLLWGSKNQQWMDIVKTVTPSIYRRGEAGGCSSWQPNWKSYKIRVSKESTFLCSLRTGMNENI